MILQLCVLDKQSWGLAITVSEEENKKLNERGFEKLKPQIALFFGYLQGIYRPRECEFFALVRGSFSAFYLLRTSF